MTKLTNIILRTFFKPPLITDNEGTIPEAAIRERARTPHSSTSPINLRAAYEKHDDSVWTSTQKGALKAAKGLAFTSPQQ